MDFIEVSLACPQDTRECLHAHQQGASKAVIEIYDLFVYHMGTEADFQISLTDR